MSCVGNCDAKDPSCHNRTRNTQYRTLQVSIVKKGGKFPDAHQHQVGSATLRRLCLGAASSCSVSGSMSLPVRLTSPDTSNLITRHPVL
ncbi:hypothetical protein CesoFtcFv8_007623 [Champsocephalus esox]|uniref:Uncharacterized protein n=1 Tax=Champsocephalus esox TaxID=159716 RepID=A0AAN8CEH8_9TELE|nr:hypothetical protein CesoFtcFv8_007623 [Champsocephalus esox]